MTTLIDIGVNLAHKSFRTDLQEVIQRSVKAGVTRLIVTGTSVDSSTRALELTKKYPRELFCTAGVHPHDAKHTNQHTVDTLRSLAKDPKVVAIGECGLDFNRDFSPRPIQEQCFHAQLQLAAELKLPVFLHERDAHERFIAILKEHQTRLVGSVVHCFTGTIAEAKTYLDLGCHLGITGWICDERRGTHLREVVKSIPLNRLMVETDAPFLTPRDIRPRPQDGRNEPAFLPHIVKTIAQCTRQTPERVAQTSTETAIAFFRLPQQ